jgi:hypothetical protein
MQVEKRHASLKIDYGLRSGNRTARYIIDMEQ